MKIGFIGLGNMATAMIGGMVKNKLVEAKDIMGSARTQETVKKAVDAYQITGAMDNREVAEYADYLVLAVKPQMYPSVIEQIRDHVRKETVVISIAAGKSIEWLCGLVQRDVQEMKLVRCMPNTPALVMEGCTGVCFAEAVTADEKEAVMKILNSFGRADEVAENLMDTVVGVSGSSPAYVFMFIEAMTDAAV